MGTRTVITFVDSASKMRYAVYQHWDGDPKTVINDLRNVSNCWRWPRWEADEFAAAYISTYKTASGNIRISSGAHNHGDLSYRYEVSQVDTDGEKALEVIISDGDGRYLDVKYITPQTEEIDA